MNQIPNIEEEVVEEVRKWFLHNVTNYSVPEQEFISHLLADKLRTTLHQQLQKARQDWLREEIVRLEVEQEKYSMSGSAEYDLVTWQALQTIIDRYHSELDQDKQ